jgi:hypothetical protein
MIYAPPPRPTRYADAAKAQLLQIAAAVLFAAALAVVYIVLMVLA